MERRAFENYFKGYPNAIPMAACRIFFADKSVGISMLMMRFVKHAPADAMLPNWTDWVDSRQVGYDLDGRLVAYDL